MTDPRLSYLVERLAAGRLSRRQFVRRAAALGLSATAAATVATRVTTAAPGRAPARSQADAKTLVIADNLKDDWITLDPGWIYEINSQAALNVVYEQLYQYPLNRRGWGTWVPSVVGAVDGAVSPVADAADSGMLPRRGPPRRD